MKKSIAVLFSVLFLPAVTLPVDAQRIPIDGYAATVNNRVITIGDVLAAIQPQEQRLRMTYSGKEFEQKVQELYDQGLEHLIQQALILEEFELKEAEIPKELVDDQVRNIIEERFDNDRSEFLSALRDQQVSVNEWRETVAEGLAVMYLRREEVSSNVAVSPTEVLNAYQESIEKYRQPEQVLLRMIVLQKGETEEEQGVKRKEAERLLERIIAGEEFAALARAASEGGRASRGGEWDWIETDKLRKELRDVASELSPGEHSGVIETEREYFMFKLEGRKVAQVTPFEQVKGEIERELQRQEEQRLTKDWIDRLKKRHYVKIHEARR